MKTILLLTMFMLVGSVFGQTKENVDSRLIENHGTEIYEILTYRKDYYKFLAWELEHAYEIISVGQLDNAILKSINTIQTVEGISFSTIEVDSPESFNFLKYNFERSKEHDVYYDLGDGRAIKFTALKVMWAQFDNSGLNNKI